MIEGSHNVMSFNLQNQRVMAISRLKRLFHLLRSSVGHRVSTGQVTFIDYEASWVTWSGALWPYGTMGMDVVEGGCIMMI